MLGLLLGNLRNHAELAIGTFRCNATQSVSAWTNTQCVQFQFQKSIVPSGNRWCWSSGGVVAADSMGAAHFRQFFVCAPGRTPPNGAAFVDEDYDDSTGAQARLLAADPRRLRVRRRSRPAAPPPRQQQQQHAEATSRRLCFWDIIRYQQPSHGALKLAVRARDRQTNRDLIFLKRSFRHTYIWYQRSKLFNLFIWK